MVSTNDQAPGMKVGVERGGRQLEVRKSTYHLWPDDLSFLMATM